MWVARKRQTGAMQLPNPTELILPQIVERKSMDDLRSSFISGRFHEQKFRFREIGVPRPIYLVEDSSGSLSSLEEDSGLPLAT